MKLNHLSDLKYDNFERFQQGFLNHLNVQLQSKLDKILLTLNQS